MLYVFLVLYIICWLKMNHHCLLIQIQKQYLIFIPLCIFSIKRVNWEKMSKAWKKNKVVKQNIYSLEFLIDHYLLSVCWLFYGQFTICCKFFQNFARNDLVVLCPLFSVQFTEKISIMERIFKKLPNSISSLFSIRYTEWQVFNFNIFTINRFLPGLLYHILLFRSFRIRILME